MKRVVAVEGDTIASKGGIIYLNGEALEEPYAAGRSSYDDWGPLKIENEQLFVLGDNRFNSADSRLYGSISEEEVIGKVMYRYYSNDGFEFDHLDNKE
ncbi:signal peptidase I [Radiobacillus kanasensis]|uniref:signal peptidase I n=1 Tax=Radiobacillus kanasensis TaxID=2844358 RepID=UPI001E520721|nr:signal peptidase I [Radiobacillus kanasensis]UFT99588.1 signal peptidase I [Radiobacillus kanasensis]